MNEGQWIQWTRTALQTVEREELLAALTSEQRTHLCDHDYVWCKSAGVLWNPPNGGPLRRARFTHGTYFQTDRGEYYIDSEGDAQKISDRSLPRARPRHADRFFHSDGEQKYI